MGPPSRGEPFKHYYLQLTREALPMFVIFRVQLSERYERSSYHCGCRDFMHQAGAGSLTKLVEKRDAESIGQELQEALIHYEKKNHLRPIKAEINIVDAAEEMHVLYNMHWSEDEAAESILQARSKRPGVRAQIAGGSLLLVALALVMISVTVFGLFRGNKVIASNTTPAPGINNGGVSIGNPVLFNNSGAFSINSSVFSSRNAH